MPSLRHLLVEATIGSAADTCQVPAEPVRFGQRYWLAQHRWLEPAVGLVALLPVGGLYLLAFTILTRPAAFALAGAWVLFMTGALILRVVRPCTVLRLPVHALLLWLLVIGTAGFTGAAA